MVIGQALMAIGAILFALADSPSKYYSHVVPGLFVGMIGLSAAFVGSTIAIMESACEGEEGIVGALTYTSYQMGATIGLAS